MLYPRRLLTIRLRGYGRDAIPSYVSLKNDKKRLNADADTRSVEKKE